MSTTAKQPGVDPLSEIAGALREQARAINRLADLHDRLWLSLKPSQRAEILGVSRNTELNRRKKAELLRRQGYDMPLRQYLFTREGLRDLAVGTALAGLCFVASYFIVRANVF